MPNRLKNETSPYLLQHADNPVDWQPWDEEALARARDEDRPILLSIGYSACHWCHVMEHESFADPDTAALMNRLFVNIKVDREERPDIDSIYMRAVQSLTGQGGWPLTAFLTPDGRPFYGGTYFPPEPRHGMPSFRQVLEAAEDAYRNRRDRVEEAADQLRELLARSTEAADPGSGEVGGRAGLPRLLDHAARHLASQHDGEWGGFGHAPKFPQADVLEFALRAHLHTGAIGLLEMVTHSLTRMADGGIYDHVGGGFARYSVDRQWLVPHFEKMLYDNALLARLYATAYQVTGEDRFADVARGTLDWLLEDMRGPEGGFYSARDADSEGEEGLFYVWTPAELEQVLGPDRAGLVAAAYGVTDAGNFEGRSVLHRATTVTELAEGRGRTVEEVEVELREALLELRAARWQREAPFRDEKVLLGWNALAIRALAEAGAILGVDRYVDAARSAAEFALAELRVDGELRHVWKDGRARIPGFLEDYAGLANALLSVHAATLDVRWLTEARRCVEEMLERFRDPEAGVFYDSAHEAEALLVRPRDITDNPTPSGNSLAIEALLRGGHITGEEGWIELAEATLLREIGSMERYPSAFGRLLGNAIWLVAPVQEVAVLGQPTDARTRDLLSAIWGRPHPARVVAGGDPAEVPEGPLFRDRGAIDGAPTAWICEGWSCRAPVTGVDALLETLDS